MTAAHQPGPWPRFALVQLAQLPSLGLACFGQGPWALWTAALVASLVCCAGTDSLPPAAGRALQRCVNGVLLVEAVLWLAMALVLGTAG